MAYGYCTKVLNLYTKGDTHRVHDQTKACGTKRAHYFEINIFDALFGP